MSNRTLANLKQAMRDGDEKNLIEYINQFGFTKKDLADAFNGDASEIDIKADDEEDVIAYLECFGDTKKGLDEMIQADKTKEPGVIRNLLPKHFMFFKLCSLMNSYFELLDEQAREEYCEDVEVV